MIELPIFEALMPEKFLLFLVFGWQRTEALWRLNDRYSKELCYKYEGWLIGFMDGMDVDWRSLHSSHQELAMRTVTAAFPIPNEKKAEQRTEDGFLSVVFLTEEDAIVAQNGLLQLISEYGFASLCEYKTLCGLPNTYIDQKWGWNEIAKTRPIKVEQGWVLDLPALIPITNRN